MELSEKRIDARTAREITVALPKELSIEQHIEIIKEFAIDNFVSKGLGCDIAIHDKGEGDPHAHITMNTREITSTGFSPLKNRELNKTYKLVQWRANYAEILNRNLEQHNINSRVSHESNLNHLIVAYKPIFSAYGYNTTDNCPTCTLGKGIL